jgi:hypothetical protein
MFGLFWDLHQQHRINQNQDRAERIGSEARSAAQAVQTLESRVNTLTLVNTALWSLLQERLGFTEGQLADRVREIDLSDGRMDGKVGSTVGVCPTCNRTMSERHRRCIYCGAESPNRKPFAGA